jgi:hypothetical protein
MPSITDKMKFRGITAPELRKLTRKIVGVFGPRRTAKPFSPELSGNFNLEFLAGLEIRLNLSKQRSECVSNRHFPHALRSGIHHFSASLRPRPVRVMAQDCHQIVVRYGKIGAYKGNAAAFCASNSQVLRRLIAK